MEGGFIVLGREKGPKRIRAGRICTRLFRPSVRDLNNPRRDEYTLASPWNELNPTLILQGLRDSIPAQGEYSFDLHL